MKIIEEKSLFDPLNQLLLVAGDEQFVSGELAGGISTLSALLEDLGEGMDAEMRARWKDRIVETVSGCNVNSYGLTVEMQKVCAATLQALQGRFYEVVEKDYLMAGGCYEEAANAMELMPGELRCEVISKVIGAVTEDERGGRRYEHLPMSETLRTMDTYMIWLLWLHAVGLWDCGGDAYCRVEGKVGDARRCYERGLAIVRGMEAAGAKAERTYLCHLSLSLAGMLLAHVDEWEKAASLYRSVADAVFFNREEKGNKEYRDMCGIIVDRDSMAGVSFEEPDWAPHISVPIARKHEESLRKLKAELGQKALDILREEFEKSEEGFPVPETCYLIAFLSELYTNLKEYDKCANVIGTGGNFDDSFIEWAVGEVIPFDEENEAFPFLVLERDQAFARGLLQRPDYKEFVEQIKRAEESHQRQEWGQMRLERKVEEIKGLPSVDKVQGKLVDDNPWLKSVANPGSVVNAEFLYQQLSGRNWGEVVMGYCNAVEEELKGFLHKQWLAFRRERFDDSYGEESRRQREQGSVLHFIAGVMKNDWKRPFWEQFVKSRFPEHKDFLSKELQRLLGDLAGLRGPSAHGKMGEREKADRARKIVMGTPEEPGLLKRLAMLHQSSGGEQAFAG